MKPRAAAKGRKLFSLAAFCLLFIAVSAPVAASADASIYPEKRYRVSTSLLENCTRVEGTLSPILQKGYRWSSDRIVVGSLDVPRRGGQAAIRARVEANIARSQAARSASRFPTTVATNAQLEVITTRAARITDRLIQNQSTYWARVYHNPALRGQRFAAAFNKNPAWARSLIRGNIMDDVAKQMTASANMPFLQITRRGVRGPDFTNQFLGKAWDVTTPGSWARHLIRYANDPYDLLPLLY